MSKRKLPVYVYPAIFLTLLALGLALRTAPAQAQDSTVCTQYAEKVLSTLGTSCGELDRNTACYGFNRVDAAFVREIDDTLFSRPADTIGLVDLQSLATAPLDPDLNQWGVAVLNMQAQVPGTLPGQAVRFILVGDVELDNTVPPEQAQTEPLPKVDVSVRTNANVRSGPGLTNNVIGGAAAGQTFQADGISLDGQWFRISFNNAWAWINRVVLNPVAGEDQLVATDGQTLAPMQAFYFRTGLSQPVCEDAPPNALVVQGPENVVVTLNVNGAEVRLASTIMFTQPDPSTLKLTTIDGLATMPGGLRVPGGFSMQTELDENGLSDSQWTNYHQLTDAERAEALFLEQIAGAVLNYGIHVPSDAEIQATIAAMTPTPRPFIPTLAPTVTPTSAAQPFAELLANPTTVAPGQCTTLYWNAGNVAEVRFEGQSYPLNGQVERCARETTTYAIEVVNFDGSVFYRTVTVEVMAQPTATWTATIPPTPDCQLEPSNPACPTPAPPAGTDEATIF